MEVKDRTKIEYEVRRIDSSPVTIQGFESKPVKGSAVCRWKRRERGSFRRKRRTVDWIDDAGLSLELANEELTEKNEADPCVGSRVNEQARRRTP